MIFRNRNRKRENDAPETRQSGFAKGCLAIALEIFVWVFSTLLITVGIFLFLFGILDFSPEARFRTVVIVLLVPITVFILIRIGRQILEDLRGGE